MAYLTWINDEELTSAVGHLIKIAKNAQEKASKDFNKNVIDPFSALIQMAGFDLDFKTWVLSEQTRQSQKTLQNHIGDFHQIVLGSVKGWENLKTGNIMDLISVERKILAEIKNKHNTVKGANLSDLYKSLDSEIMPKSSRYRGYTAYYVTIIPKKTDRFDLPFVPSDKQTGTKLPKNEKIRVIDGASFYSLVTGVDNALEQLFSILPTVIEDIIGTKFSSTDRENLRKFYLAAYG
ncbi:MAG: Eco47II family restriction endonuclease [Fulvivirga sp.]